MLQTRQYRPRGVQPIISGNVKVEAIENYERKTDPRDERMMPTTKKTGMADERSKSDI
jgi:hypothetical protein